MIFHAGSHIAPVQGHHPKETSCPILCDRHTDSIGQYTSHKAKSTSIASTTTTAPCNHYKTLTCCNTADIPQNRLPVKLVQKHSLEFTHDLDLERERRILPLSLLGDLERKVLLGLLDRLLERPPLGGGGGGGVDLPPRPTGDLLLERDPPPPPPPRVVSSLTRM